MWFVGLIAGALFGGAVGGEVTAVFGALAGALLGWQLRRVFRGTARESGRLVALETQVRELAATVDQLRSRIRTLEGAPEAAPAAGEAAAASAEPPVLAAAGTPEVATETTPALAALVDAGPVPVPAEPAAAAAAPEPAAPEEGPAPPPLSQPWGGGPSLPAWLQRAFAWFSGGNAVVRVGIVVLFFGVAFLLKYAYDNSRLPPELRIGGAMLAGVVLLALGWKLRHRRPAFALPLQGGAVGIMYLAVFGALRLYALIPAGAAFALLAVLCAGTVVLSLLQNVQALAVLAVAGGFLAPVLVSTGTGNHVALFSYYAVLNLGILAIASRRAWRPLNLTGFAFTFVIGAMWGARYYRPDLWASTQPFLAAFFLIYLALPALFARRSAAQADAYLDGTLVYGLPIVAFALQAQLMRETEYGLALSSLAAAACYVVAARIAHRRQETAVPLLVLSFASLAFVFATLAIPLALDARWSSAAWALEGAAVAWIGLRQGRWLPRVAGYLLQIGAAVLFLDSLGGEPPAIPVLNRDALGFVFLAAAAGFTAFVLERHAAVAHEAERIVRYVALAAAGLWWTAGVIAEADRFLPDAAQSSGLAAAFALSCLAADWARERLPWPSARVFALALAPLLKLALLPAWIVAEHPFGMGGIAAWPAALAAAFWILRRHDRDALATPALLPAILVWVAAGALVTEGRWLGITYFEAGSAWAAAFMLAAATLLIAVIVRRERTGRWPLVPHTTGFLALGAGLLAAALYAATLAVNFWSDGAAPQLPYIPVLNPLDLASVAALLALAFWVRAARRHPFGVRLAPTPAARYAPLGAAAFLVGNAILLRTLHHHAGAPLAPGEVLGSTVAQAGLSLFWTVIALGLMVGAHRTGSRPLWLTGAALLGVTVLKLFVIDLSHAATVARIVSFVGVGVLMLAVGYLAPVPPKRENPAP